jgi:hypothetical protein
VTDSPGDGRSLAEPAFPDDDGSADADVRARLFSASEGVADPLGVVRSLRGSRLLTSVVAVLDSAGDDGEEKDSHMAVVSMVNAAGEHGLLAFTGLDALVAWNPDARPVPAFGRDVARAALESGATAVVVDVAGPRKVAITGTLLRALADDLDLQAITARVREVLAPLAGPGARGDVIDTREGVDGLPARELLGIDPSEVDVLVVVFGVDGDAAAELFDADEVLRALVPGGIALLPLG